MVSTDWPSPTELCDVKSQTKFHNNKKTQVADSVGAAQSLLAVCASSSSQTTTSEKDWGKGTYGRGGWCPWRGNPDVSSSEFSGAHTPATQNSRVLCPNTEDFFSAELQKPANSYGPDSFLQLGFSVLSAFWSLRLKRAINSKAFSCVYVLAGGWSQLIGTGLIFKKFQVIVPWLHKSGWKQFR